MKIVALIMLLATSQLVGGMKIYERLGDLPETADIYQYNDDRGVFVDASSVPPEYRARFKNKEMFTKVDMSKVKESAKVSKNGMVVYDKVEHSKNNSDIFKLGNTNSFLDYVTVPEELKSKLDSKLSGFEHIGKVLRRSKSVENQLVAKIESVLESIGFMEDTETTGNMNVDEKIEKYNEVLSKYKGKVVVAFDRYIDKSSSSGKLEEVEMLMALKRSYLADDTSVTEDDLKAFSSARRALRSYLSTKEREGKKVAKAIEYEIRNETRSGNLTVAKSLDELKMEYIHAKTTISDIKESSINDFLIKNTWVRVDKNYTHVFNENGTCTVEHAVGTWSYNKKTKELMIDCSATNKTIYCFTKTKNDLFTGAWTTYNNSAKRPFTTTLIKK